VAALRSARLYDTVQAKLVMGESLAQAAQLVESGNADIGLLSRSLALGPARQAEGINGDGRAPYPAIEQAGNNVKTSREPALARTFMAFLRRDDTGRQLERFGFTVPSR
jgi:molybdate transport system substrate-binding protein